LLLLPGTLTLLVYRLSQSCRQRSTIIIIMLPNQAIASTPSAPAAQHLTQHTLQLLLLLLLW
jgi:hypothetical protein